MVTASFLRGELGVPEPPRSCQWGSVFRVLGKERWIRKCGFRESTVPSRRGSAEGLWVRTELR
jgi:hypothetical protein